MIREVIVIVWISVEVVVIVTVVVSGGIYLQLKPTHSLKGGRSK
jgi:hypothetical protein